MSPRTIRLAADPSALQPELLAWADRVVDPTQLAEAERLADDAYGLVHDSGLTAAQIRDVVMSHAMNASLADVDETHEGHMLVDPQLVARATLIPMGDQERMHRADPDALPADAEDLIRQVTAGVPGFDPLPRRIPGTALAIEQADALAAGWPVPHLRDGGA